MSAWAADQELDRIDRFRVERKEGRKWIHEATFMDEDGARDYAARYGVLGGTRRILEMKPFAERDED